MYYAAIDSGGPSPFIGFVWFEFTDGTQALYSFYYQHTVTLEFPSKLCGNGTVGSYNTGGTVSNASKTTIFIIK